MADLKGKVGLVTGGGTGITVRPEGVPFLVHAAVGDDCRSLQLFISDKIHFFRLLPRSGAARFRSLS
jgi:hypothetical protein